MIIPEDIKKELTDDLRQALDELTQHNFNGELKNKIYESTKKLVNAYNDQKKIAFNLMRNKNGREYQS